MILFVILSFALLHCTSASPIITADVEADAELPAIEGFNGNRTHSIITADVKAEAKLRTIEEYNGNRTRSISTADVKADTELPTSEGYNGNRTHSISTFYVPTSGAGTHKFHKTQKKNWDDARNVCLNEGGHLVVINSAAEEAAIIKLLVDSKINEEVWIGVHEQFKKDEWVSVKDERIDAIGYIHWRQGEPNNFNNEGEHCLVINQQGMNDQTCSKQFFFICEI